MYGCRVVGSNRIPVSRGRVQEKAMPFAICNYAGDRKLGGKFVVLLSREDPDDGILVLSDFSRDFQHRDIVMRWESSTGRSVSVAGLKVAGGGWWKYEMPDQLIVYGQSAAYGRFDPSWLRERLVPGAVFGEERIDVR